MLNDLAAAFVAASEHLQRDGPFSITAPLLAGIKRIGGKPAIDLLEELAANPRRTGAQWLYTAVDELRQIEATKASSEAVQPWLEDLGLPSAT